MKFKHIKSNKTKSFSVLIIPQSNEIKQFKVFQWIPKLLTFLIIITVSSSSYFILDLFTSYNKLEDAYFDKSRRIDLLSEINDNQKEEINYLEARFTEFEEQLMAISELEQTVMNRVGLEQQENDDTNTDEGNNGEKLFTYAETSLTSDSFSLYPVSRSGYFSMNLDTIEFDSLNNREEQICALSNMLEKSQKELNVLINDVEERLAYLDAKPNLEPTVGRITSPFGYRRNPLGRGTEFHSGIDIANNRGTKIKAAGSGVVVFAGYNSGYGRLIVIKHGYGYESMYGHNRKLLVKVGDHVKKGQIIAEMGSTGRSTGPHLHFEIRYNKKSINPKTVLNNND